MEELQKNKIAVSLNKLGTKWYFPLIIVIGRWRIYFHLVGVQTFSLKTRRLQKKGINHIFSQFKNPIVILKNSEKLIYYIFSGRSSCQ